jgi:secreted trypsin-like serine protease
MDVTPPADFDQDINVLQVLFGSSNLTTPQTLFDVRNAFIHPSYSVSTATNERVNLAWMELAESVPLDAPGVVPVVLAAPEDTAFFAEGVGAVVSGWGAVDTTVGTSTDILQMAQAQVQNSSVCDALMVPAGQQALVDSIYLCAGDGVSAPCRGDAGSALRSGVAGESKQIGVVVRNTNAEGTCGGTVYGIYTRVAPYRSYIQSLINEPLYDGN